LSDWLGQCLKIVHRAFIRQAREEKVSESARQRGS